MEPRRDDYYRVLQVDPSANALVIQAAYRVLARIFHPDVDGDALEMTRINQAWDVLGDAGRRAAYDRERAGRHPEAAARAADDAAASSFRTEDHAGPPQGEPFGPVLHMGRYAGWSLGQVMLVDRPFLEWLRRAPAGRGLAADIDALLETKKGPGAVDQRRHYQTNQRQQQVHSWRPGASTRVG